MTTSSFMPDVKVEIAFNAGFGTPAGSRTWTDVSQWVELAEGISITFGRQDERATADANQLSLTLDNSDGRFTAGRVTSPYYPNVKLDRPIRVTATPVDGPASVRFLGYINEWPVEWDGTENYAKADVSASSRLSRLGYQASLRSIVEETILGDAPEVYYTLGEPADATQANDSSGVNASPMSIVGDGPPVVFGNGTGPGTDGLTAVQFAGSVTGGVLSGQFLSSGSLALAAPGFTLECFFATATPATGVPTLVSARGQFDNSLGLNFVDGTVIAASAGQVISSPKSYADGSTHHAAITVSTTGAVALYMDGALVGSTSGGFAFPIWNFTQISAGRSYTGTLSHVALTPGVLSTAQIKNHADSGLAGFLHERTDARLTRYAALANVAPAEVVAEVGQTTMAHLDTTDKQVVEMLRTVESTEGGVLFDDRDGTMVMHSRAHRYTTVSSYILDMRQQMVDTSYAPKLDRSTLLNDISASNSDGTVTARLKDDASIADYGLVTASLETASDNNGEPQQAAAWRLAAYKEPKARVSSLAVDALAQVGATPSCSAILATTIGTKITVANHPQQAAYALADYFVEGYSETYGLESLRFVFNVSPSAPYDQVLIWDDPIRGLWDSGAVWAY